MELGEGLAKEGQDARQPDHERAAVVDHELERCAAQLDAVVEPVEDGCSLRPRQDAQADQEPGVVIDEADDPDLLVLASAATEEDRALDVDVPELVGATSLVRRATFPADRRAGGAVLSQQAVDGVVIERVDLTPGELGGQTLRVPLRQQADDDHRLLDPCGQPLPVRAARSIEEGRETADGIPGSPAVETRPAGPKCQRSSDALLSGDPDAASAKAKTGENGADRTTWRPTATGRQEQEARSFLVIFGL